MRTFAGVAVAVCLVLSLQCRAGGAGESAAAKRFPVAGVHLEQNATDGDVEVVFEVLGGNDGLANLTIVGPDGRTVAAFSAPEPSTLGMRQFRFESPEPTDVARMHAAYPEGEYAFTGATAAGEQYAGTATLSHRLPPPAAVSVPDDEAAGVPTDGLRITWTPVTGIAGYTVTIEQHQLGFSLSVTLPPTVTVFAVPTGVLRPGRAYQLAIGTRLAGGNASFTETTFSTAGKE